MKRGVNGVELGVFGVWARGLGAGGCSGVGGVVGGGAFLLGKVFWSTVVDCGGVQMSGGSINLVGVMCGGVLS